MAEKARRARPDFLANPWRWSRRFSLTTRILAVNILPLALLGGGIFYLDSYRKQLLSERYKLARIEAQITAEALAGASRERQEAVLTQIGKEQHMRVRMFDSEGRLWADSFALDKPTFEFDRVGDETWQENLARWLDRAVNVIVGADPIPDYVEPNDTRADVWPELRRAREEHLTQIELREAPDGTPVITAAAPVGLMGATLLTTRNAVDITQKVRAARSTLGMAVGLALLISILLSLYMARTIVTPLRTLARAAIRVRLGREREVEVPRLPERQDEIGLLARAVADMTGALRHRIDAVESFAADVAHEIKNPLASLRSAIDSLGKVEDPALRRQLIEVAAHDVRRIDRLVSEISEASRIDAELSRATFEPVDMAALVENVIGRREFRGENGTCRVGLTREGGSALVMGVPLRLERVIDNLLDNAVSFSPDGGTIAVRVARHESRVETSVCDQGPGIPADAREKVFARFHSLRPEAEDFGNHSGLGLAIGRTIAEAHDGTLIVREPEDGDGACLVLSLPSA
jgi:two-component system sensor histidine kinase ChvG